MKTGKPNAGDSRSRVPSGTFPPSDVARGNPTLLEFYRKHHAAEPRYGSTATRKAAKYCAETLRGRDQVVTVLDYGAGKRSLEDHFRTELPRLQVTSYDPAIPGIDVLPDRPFDAVVSTDVFEHIEEADLPGVLADIRIRAKRCVCLYIAQSPTRKFLPDGRDLHVTLWETPRWVSFIAQHCPTWHLMELLDLQAYRRGEARKALYLSYDIS